MIILCEYEKLQKYYIYELIFLKNLYCESEITGSKTDAKKNPVLNFKVTAYMKIDTSYDKNSSSIRKFNSDKVIQNT